MATKYAQQDGDWSDDIADTTWYDAESGGNAVDHPDEGDNAIINAGITITIDDVADATIIAGDDTSNAINVKGVLQYLSTAGVDHILQCKGHLYITSGGSLKIGTAANPIPAARTFTIKLNYSGTPAEGKWGLLNYGELILQGDPARITVTKCLLNTDEAIDSVDLVSDVNTGWKDNDDIAIASTTRTWTEAENGKMNGDAVTTALTVDGFGGVAGGLAYAHSGTSPTQAEIINLTRNVKVTSHTPASYRGYVCCYSGSTSDVDYVEFYMIGYNATYKHGIEIRTTAVDATNFAYCSVWGKAASNYAFYIYITQNVIIDNCVIYNTDEELFIHNSENTITNNIIMKISDYGVYFYRGKGTFDNNTATSCSSYGCYIYKLGTPTFTSFNNNTIHSCGSYVYCRQCDNLVIDNTVIWRNNSVGIYFRECTNATINTLTAFGNGSYNIYIYLSGSIIFTDISLNGDSTFSTSYGVYFTNSSYGIIKIAESALGVASGIKVSHSSADIYFNSSYFNQVVTVNTKLSSTTKISNINNAIVGSYIQCEDLDQTQYNDKAWYKYGIVVRDGSTKKTASYSMRFDYLWAADDWVDYEVEIPVKDGESVVVSAWLRKNSSYTSANRPKIKLNGMGITETEDQMSDVTDTWEKVTVSGTPTRTGLAKLTIMTYMTNSGASAWCDFEKTGLTMPVLNTLEGSFWADGHISQILFDTGSITAKEFWETLLSGVDKSGSFGNLLEDYLNAAVSSRSSHSAADVDTTLTASHSAGSWAGATTAQIWSAAGRELSTPNNYKADVSTLALEATLTAIKGATFAEATDSLEAIRNRGDIAWLTATGFSTHTAAAIWVAANRALSTPADYKADVSALATSAELSTHDAKLDTVDAIVDRILTATEIEQATINDASATTTKFITTLTETANTFWTRAGLLFTSGNDAGQIRGIKSYNGTTKEVQIQTPLSYAPADGDAFIIIPARKFLTPDTSELADAVWDEILTGATHNIATSAGKRLRQIGAYNIHDGTAQATSTCCSITLAATASSEDYIYNRNLIVIIDGTGAGQTRTIADYDGTTKIAVVDRNWWTLPDDTSEYYILADDTPLVVDHGVAQGGESTSITLRSSASAIDETYTGSVIVILASTGEGQSRLITAYDGTTKVATITPAWETNPTSSSIYVVMPYGCSCVGNLTDSALAQINATLESAHGTNSWKTATGFAKPSDVKCGGVGGGAIIERPAIWKLEEKLKLIEDIKKIYKTINELSSLQSTGLQNVKKNIEELKNSLLKLIKEEVALLISLKVIISEQPKTDTSVMLADPINQIIAKWDSIQKSILKPSDLSSLDTKLDDITKIVAKSLSNKTLEKLINEE